MNADCETPDAETLGGHQPRGGEDAPTEFQQMLASVYRGDEAAAKALFGDFSPHLLRVIRHHLNLSVRTSADSEDFMQDVWLAFLKDLPKNRNFDTPEQLAAFLGQVARNKVIDTIRRCFTSQKANVNREVRLDHFAAPDEMLADLHSTPSEKAIRNEVQENILKSLLPAHRHIGEMIFAGVPLAEIATATGLSLKTIERVRDRILVKLQ